VERYNATVNKLVDIVTWWMSLNNTQKNSQDNIEKLILETENIITQESIMWSGLSDLNVKGGEKEGENKSSTEDKEKNKTE